MTGLPETHANFVEQALAELKQDERIMGVAVGGSFIARTMDQFSDIDFVIVVDPTKIQEVMLERKAIAARLSGTGRLVAAFTGEHVGEPRLLVCLYDDPVLHVDLKFVSLADAAARVEDPAILWERAGELSTVFKTQAAAFPCPDLQWIEDRFWVWIHYIATKIGRGELFETIDTLAVIRARVLGPLSLLEVGARPSGVRKIEQLAPARAKELIQTVASYDAHACITSLQAAIALYLSLRDALRTERLQVHTEAQRVALDYLQAVANGL